MAHKDAGLTVVTIDKFDNLFETADGAYIGGEPTLEMLEWLKSQGVTLVINLRAESENQDFAASKFDEKDAVEKLGLAYRLVPMAGEEAFAPATVEAFAAAMEGADGKVLVHCRSAGRATYLWMAYLIRHRGVTLDDALVIGQQMKFVLSPLGGLLGGQVQLTLE